MDSCKKPDKHNEHICQLKLNQQFDKVRELGRDSNFFCTICEAQSNQIDAVCSPRKFQGKPGVLKWK